MTRRRPPNGSIYGFHIALHMLYTSFHPITSHYLFTFFYYYLLFEARYYKLTYMNHLWLNALHLNEESEDIKADLM